MEHSTHFFKTQQSRLTTGGFRKIKNLQKFDFFRFSTNYSIIQTFRYSNSPLFQHSIIP